MKKKIFNKISIILLCLLCLNTVIPIAAVWKKDSWSKRSVQIPEGEVKSAMILDVLPSKQRLSHSALTAEVHYTGAAVPVKVPARCRLYFIFIFFNSLQFTHLVISRVDFISLYHANSSFTTMQTAKSAKILMNSEQKFERKTVQVYKLKKYF